jgi:hypothetical protein
MISSREIHEVNVQATHLFTFDQFYLRKVYTGLNSDVSGEVFNYFWHTGGYTGQVSNEQLILPRRIKGTLASNAYCGKKIRNGIPSIAVT